MNRSILIVLAVLILGSAGFGVVQLDEIRKLKQNLSALDQERTALQKRIWDLQKRNGDLERRLQRPATDSTVVDADGPVFGEPPPANNPTSDGPRPRGRPDGGRFAAIMGSPEVQKLMAAQQKAGLDGHYASLFKQLNLSPADLEKFKNLLVEKQSAVMDVMAAARAEGLTGRENRDQIRQLVSDAQTEVDNSIRSTLGEAAYAQYQNYETTVPQRNVVSQLEQRLSYSSSPLTEAQSTQLVQILAATSPANSNPGRTAAAGLAQVFVGTARSGPAAMLAGGSSPITNDAITQAQGVLSAQQLAAMQALQQEQQASAQLMQQMRTNFGARNQGTTATGTAPKTTGSGGP